MGLGVDSPIDFGLNVTYMQEDVYSCHSEKIPGTVRCHLLFFSRITGFLILFTVLCQSVFAQISGTVYRDFNEDGVRSYSTAAPLAGEIGVGGVTVNLYSSTGLVATTTTSSATGTAAGTYSFTGVTSGTIYRLEFVNLPTGTYDGPKGTNSATSIQFVTAPTTTANFGINDPADYCQASPTFILPCYVNGNSTGTGTSSTAGVLVTLPYSATSSGTSNTTQESAAGLNNQIGTVYGVAYQRATKFIYTSAFVKRHSGLGPSGAGAIYISKPSGTTFTHAAFTTLPTAVSAVSAPSIGGTTVVGTNSGRGLPNALTALNHDETSFDQVGKAGLGDLEISDDGTELYVVNLGDRSLYKIPIINPTSANPTAGTPTSYTLPAVSQTSGSVFRPFALKYYRDKVYIGGVTTNEAVSTTLSYGTGSTGGSTAMRARDTTGMKAVVFEFNPSTGNFTTVLTFPLTYQKGASDNDQTGVSRADRWYPWTNVQAGTGLIPNRYARNDLANASYPQPILADIEFDPVDGAMILAIRDRFGDQYGNNNYGTSTSDNSTLYRAISPGDILRAGKCTTGVNQWTIENNARICNGVPTAGANTSQGPGGGEYYYGDAIALPNTSNPYHLEMAGGGLALFPGKGEVASVVMDPTNSVDAGGIRRFKNSDGSGSPATSVQVYVSSDVATYGKANGLGDLELACDLPAVQIGNRVWRDNNNNGIQDPGELGLAGVQVVLTGPGGTTVATATTDTNGEYYFSTATGTTTSSSVYNLTLTSGGSYTLSFPTSVSAFNISTLPNSATGTNADAIDSDASAAGIITLTLGASGENNFTFDAGYACAPLALSLTSATICAGQTVSLTATSGFSSYTFSSGLTQIGASNVASGTATGTYTVTAVNSAGCYGTATGTITVNPLPVVSLSSATICAGTSATLVATSGYASYTFSAGLTRIGTTNMATGTTAGTYSVTAVSSAGCTGVASGTGLGSITINTNPTAVLTSTTICAGTPATLTASGGSSYVFSNGTSNTTGILTVSPTNTTVYSVTVTSGAGCSAVASGTVTVNPSVTATMTSATICSGMSATLTASGGSSYHFSTGLTNTTGMLVVSPTSTTAYSVTVTSGAGCSAVASGTVTVNPSVTATITSATICSGMSATLTASGGSSYVFSNGTSNTTGVLVVSPTSTTAYSVTVTSGAGCSAVASGTVTVNPSVTATMTSATICSGVSATLTASGGSSYHFSTGLTNTTGMLVVSPTSTTAYSVTVTSGAGCSAVASGTVTVNPSVTATMTSATICSGVSATLTASGGSSYHFSTGLTNTTGMLVVSPTSTTAYSVTVTSGAGCSAVASGTVTVNSFVTGSLTSATICSGMSATLTASGGSSYVFSNGTSNTTGVLVVSPTSTTAYSVTVTSGAGCSAVASGTVTVNPSVTATMTSATVCAGESATLVATGGSSYTFSTGDVNTTGMLVVSPTSTTAYSVTVTSGAGCSAVASGTVTVNPSVTATMTSATICSGMSATLTASGGSSYVFSNGTSNTTGVLVVSPTSTTAYSVTVSSGAGCSAVASGTVTVNPSVTATMTSATICSGVSATLTASGGSSYHFSTGLTNTTGLLVVSPTSTTAYSVTVTSGAGCSAVASGTVTVNPSVTATMTSATVCAGESATLVATGGSSYTFSTGDVNTTGMLVVSPASTTAYSVTVVNGSGCMNSVSATVVVNPLPVVTMTSATICMGQSTTLTATTGFDTYVFSSGLVQIGSSNMATGTTAGTYSVTAISSAGCSATAMGSISVSPVVNVTLTSATICTGQMAVLTATPGYDTYIFSTGLTPLVGQPNMATAVTAGTYSVTAISTAGCSGTATATITENPAAVVALSSATICAGQSATLTATPGFDTYVFSAGITQIGSSNMAVGTVAGTYSVTATSGAGCTGSASGDIAVNPLPTATILVSSATICQGESATMTASGGATYVWSTNEQTASITVSADGVYSVTVTSAEGCSDVTSTTITVNPLPVLTINSATVCAGQSATLTVGGCDGGTIQWSMGDATVSVVVSPTLTTTYSATCVLSTGCSSTTSTTVTVNAMPTLTAGPPQAVTATCTGAVANNDAHIDLTGLINAERADIVMGSTYGNGPVYGAPTNLTVTAGAVSFTNLPNPITSQPYTIRLYSSNGTCYIDVTVILEPAICNCPDPKCVPIVIQKIKSARTAIR
ncbi:SdrD B-like domain-containing protein [Spirosoma sp. SC4-14]|uniref:beta strand repeat-containing protein n=1 Tax=Spirosoma sp. SC4-14 TaxID=3128900 RepID=UPI0030CE5431